MPSHPPSIAIFVSIILAFFLNSTGLLQLAERQVYDYFLRSRPIEPQDESIVIVGISEKDLEKYGFPLTDETLANLLLAIAKQNPSVIGMDLHRNVGVGDGEKKLKEVFKTTDNLIGVEKTDGGNPKKKTISPPSELKKAGRTGASQIIEDSSNGIVRRGYLYVNQSGEEEMVPGLGLAVALKYLENQGISPSGYGKKNWLKLGNAKLPGISNNYFYALRQIDGYQILINYRSSRKKFKQITVSEVLENKRASAFFRDKVVFVGSVAETVDDIYLTPLSPLNSDFTYGVELHAELASQVINAALNERTIIRLPVIFWQYVYLAFWLGLISWLSWYLFIRIKTQNQQSILYLAFSCLSLSIILVSGYLSLLLGWWVPTVTALIVGFSSEIIIYIFLLKQLIIISNNQLESARKKILSQEKLAVYNKSAKLIAHELKNKVNILQSSVDLAEAEVTELQRFIDNMSFLFEIEDESTALASIENLSHELETVKKEGQKITSTINRIYNTSIDNGAEYREQITCNLIESLNKILVNFQQWYQARYPEREIKINKEYQLTGLGTTEIPLEIELALQNIIENAFYYVGKKIQIANDDWTPKIEIILRERENLIELKIKDNGVGIAPMNLDKVFTDFWTTKSAGEGMGLGLYLAKESLEKYQGSISVTSREGDYTEFVVRIPPTPAPS